jgi:hypothetical protein
MEPAMARQSLKEGRWLTVATAGWNRNKRRYSEAALASMAEGLTGKLIMKYEDCFDSIEGDIGRSLGVVADTRRGLDGRVQVQVIWFAHEANVEGVLTPSGIAHEYKETEDGLEVLNYEPKSMELSEYSGFEGATTL